MCPPVSVRRLREGMTYLYAAWMYELQHGEPLRLCFPCFKVAFLDLKDTLETEEEEAEGWEEEEEDSDDWEEEDWDLELEEGPVQAGLGPEASGQSPVQPKQGDLKYLLAPTDLEPQDAVVLGPKEDDWTQALPWRFQHLIPCTHWP